MKKAIIIIVIIVIILLPDKESNNKNNVNKSTNTTNTSKEITSTPTPTHSNSSNDASSLKIFSPNDNQVTVTPTNSPTPKPTKTPTPKPTSTPTPKPKKLTGKLDEYEKDYYVFYVVNTNTKKFHTKYCRYVKQIYESNKYFATDHGFADAESARSWLTKNGYDFCKVCNP